MLLGSNTILFAKFKSKQDALDATKVFNKILKKREKNYTAHITMEDGYYGVVSTTITSEKEKKIIINDIQNYFDGVDDPILTSHHNHTFRFIVGIGYDDNIYSHTTLETTDYGEIEFDNNTSQISDRFHREIISYYHTYNFENDKWDWNTYINLYNRSYQDHNDVNIFQMALYTGPKYFFNHGNISLSVFGEKLWYGSDEYMNSYGINTKLAYKFTDKSRSDIELSLMEKRYDEKQREDWDSNRLSLKTGTTFYASENYAFRIEGGGTLERKINGGRTDVSYNTYFVSAKYMMPLWDDAHLSLKLGVESRDYQDKSPNLQKREDTKWRFKSDLSQRLTDTLTVLLNYKYTNNDSNINSYTYKNNTVILNLLSTY
jgi:hypothetical protein